ncbi:hypothetical protein E2542_SST25665 [Spatholobus suberectus]|nr:hypothetical protein E2542_SST25665 [Spatholobus suberectus]
MLVAWWISFGYSQCTSATGCAFLGDEVAELAICYPAAYHPTTRDHHILLICVIIVYVLILVMIRAATGVERLFMRMVFAGLGYDPGFQFLTHLFQFSVAFMVDCSAVAFYRVIAV